MKKNFAFLVMTLMAAPSLMAFNPQPEPPGFGAVGILSTQTARLNVYFAPQPAGFPPGPCTGMIQLRFMDSAGGVLATKTARLSPTAVESLEFSATGRELLRTQVRADISWVTFPPGPCRSMLFGNVEVYSNASGETQFVLPGLVQGIVDADRR